MGKRTAERGRGRGRGGGQQRGTKREIIHIESDEDEDVSSSTSSSDNNNKKRVKLESDIVRVNMEYGLETPLKRSQLTTFLPIQMTSYLFAVLCELAVFCIPKDLCSITVSYLSMEEVALRLLKHRQYNKPLNSLQLMYTFLLLITDKVETDDRQFKTAMRVISNDPILITSPLNDGGILHIGKDWDELIDDDLDVPYDELEFEDTHGPLDWTPRIYDSDKNYAPSLLHANGIFYWFVNAIPFRAFRQPLVEFIMRSQLIPFDSVYRVHRKYVRGLIFENAPLPAESILRLAFKGTFLIGDLIPFCTLVNEINSCYENTSSITERKELFGIFNESMQSTNVKALVANGTKIPRAELQRSLLRTFQLECLYDEYAYDLSETRKWAQPRSFAMGDSILAEYALMDSEDAEYGFYTLLKKKKKQNARKEGTAAAATTTTTATAVVAPTTAATISFSDSIVHTLSIP